MRNDNHASKHELHALYFALSGLTVTVVSVTQGFALG